MYLLLQSVFCLIPHSIIILNFRSMKLYVYICNVCVYYWSPLACLWYGGTHISTSLNMMMCWLNINLFFTFFDCPEEWGNKLFQNMCNKLPLETTSCPRKLDLCQQCCETSQITQFIAVIKMQCSLMGIDVIYSGWC